MSALPTDATPSGTTVFHDKMCRTASRRFLSRSLDACARTTARAQACNVKCPNTAQETSGVDTRAQVLRRERKHQVVEASGKSRMQSQRQLRGPDWAFWVFCLALHHHQWTGTTPAFVVMIATYDSVLIAQSTGTVGTVKQRQCVVR